MMIVGWDANGDGRYPPADGEDIAVLDGQTALEWVLDNRSAEVSHLEVAHLLIRDYLQGAGSSAGLLNLNGTGFMSHIYLHDHEILRVNNGQGWSWSTGLPGWSR